MVNRPTNTHTSQLILREKLIELGLRKVGNFTLHSGIISKVHWEIEELLKYPVWIQYNALKPFLWQVGLWIPDLLVGIRRGGLELAKILGKNLDIPVLDENYHCNNKAYQGRCPRTVLVDDAISTGNTVREYLKKSDSIVAVAVLVNRSGLDEIEGIPVITGCFSDKV